MTASGTAAGAQQANDPAMGAAMGERMGQDFSWLFGRRSYDGMLTYWNEAGGVDPGCGCSSRLEA